MELKIRINMDNDAYCPSFTEELKTNLEEVIACLEAGQCVGVVHDTNGNSVGEFEIFFS